VPSLLEDRGAGQAAACLARSSLEMLWRTLALVFACVFIIPIPWAMRWYTQWYVSQFELVERAA
jgi:hypothetical protein